MVMSMVAWASIFIQATPGPPFSETRVEEDAPSGQEGPPFSAVGFLDLPIRCDKLHQLYMDNTRKLEDRTYSKKIIHRDLPSDKSFDLVFRHFLIGRLFILRESHRKMKLADTSFPLQDAGFNGLEGAEVWLIHKRLLPETKSRWVGKAFNELDADIALIDMGNLKTRVYVFFKVDVVDVKSTKDVEALITAFFNDLRELI